MRMDEESQEMAGLYARPVHGIISFSQPVRTENSGLSQAVHMDDGFSTKVLDSQVYKLSLKNI